MLSIFKRFFFYIFLLIVLLGLDILFKQYVFCSIPLMGWENPVFPFGGIGVFQNLFGLNFSICHVHNTGCAWGMFSQFSAPLFFVRIVLIITLLIYMLFFNKEKRKTLPLFLIVTGAVGNIIDFFVYGKVIDMFYFYWKTYSFPVFNIADAYISIGIFLLFFHSRVMDKQKKVSP